MELSRPMKDKNLAENSPEKLNFSLYWTEDGSPTLEMSGLWSEAMHSRVGALSESLFIYGEALKSLKDLKVDARILSVGLGVGYNEWISAAEFPDGLGKTGGLTSYEISETLRGNFLDLLEISAKSDQNSFFEYLRLQTNSAESPSSVGSKAVTAAQAAAAAAVANHYGVSVQVLAQRLLSWRKLGLWQMREVFGPSSLTAEDNYSCVLFDPFSGFSQPELWSPEALEMFFGSAFRPVAVFTTYAATGELKRVLRRHGFDIVRSKGFGNKRESTLAVKKGEC